jgi:hypothetical protein
MSNDDEFRMEIAALNAAFYSIIDYSWSLIEQQAMAVYAIELSAYYVLNPGYRE